MSVSLHPRWLLVLTLACLSTTSSLRRRRQPWCDDEMDRGPGNQSIPRWYFNAEFGACTTFGWSGQYSFATNERQTNNFATITLCQRDCEPF